MSNLPTVTRYDDAEMIQTITQTVCKGATPPQLRMFIEVCKKTGLDPFLKEIWYVAEKGIIMAGRDGYLRVANENPQFDGMETRVDRDEKNQPIKAVCTVWRKDRTHPIVCEAYYSEYQKQSPVWKQYPSAMISKVAEVLALKRSFAINGVVTDEEIGNGEAQHWKDAAADPRGSSEAAQAIAQQKITELQARQVRVLDAVFTDEQPAEEALHEDIQKFVPKTPKNPSKSLGARHIDMLQAFGGLKKRYQAMNVEKAYYSMLKRNGVEKSNGFTATDAGLAAGLACYREMLQNVQELEAFSAKMAEQEVPQ